MEIILVIVFIVFIGIIVWGYYSLPDDFTEEEKAEKKLRDEEEEKAKIRAKDEEGEDKIQINYYYSLWLFVCGIFGLMMLLQSGGYDNYTDLLLLDWFLSFLSTGFLPLILVSGFLPVIISAFTKINLGKWLFWTALIVGVAGVIGSI